MPRGGCRENAGRKSTWSNSETKLIRVPVALAGQLLELAQKLDKGEAIDFVTESKPEPEVTKSPDQINLVDEVSGDEKKPPLSPLIAKDLGTRLEVSRTTVWKHAQNLNSAQFLEWSCLRDPQGYGWAYNEADKLYYCVL